ncbi:MAG: hypothetical protein RHS_1259 [Robinsoniella sp. RHS]|nr:MAG: hypothetical protein RHS_1259 [Robinsoniella sp. RHS]
MISSDSDYENAIQFFMTIPGVKRDSAITIISEIGIDMARRGKNRAIVAIARMILTAIYQMLSTVEAWNPSDLYKVDMPEALMEK